MLNYPGMQLNGKNWHAWKYNIERFLSSRDLWKVTSGVEIKPPKPHPPRSKCTVDQGLRHAREVDAFNDWSMKSNLAYRWIKAACGDIDRARLESCDSGQAAIMILQELYEPTPQQRWQAKSDCVLPSDHWEFDEGKRSAEPGYAKWHVYPLHCLSQLHRYGGHGFQHNVRLKQEVELLAPRCERNGYALPRWMICQFFRKAMNLNAAEQDTLNAHEIGAEMDIGDTIHLLRRQEFQVYPRT